MGVKTLAQGFLKEETGNSPALAKVNGKKAIITVLATTLATGLMLSPSSYEQLSAKEDFIPLESKVIVENLARSDRANGSFFLDASTWVNGRENFFPLRYPLKRSDNREAWGSTEINSRADFYLYKPPKPYDGVPQYIANGNESDMKYSGGRGLFYDNVNKALSEALKNQKQLATFSIKENQKNSDFELELKTTDKKLIANRNLNLIVVSYLDYANNNSPDKLPKGYDYPDFIYNNLVRELPLGSEGKRIMFKNDGLIKDKFSFKKITDENRQQSGFVAFVQDRSTKEILATATCRLANLDGIDKPMYLNWNNQPENVFDEYYKNEENVKKILNYTGLQEMTLNVKDIPTNTDLKKIGIEIGKSGGNPGYIDSEYFDILGYTIPQSLQENIKYLDFDPDTSRLEIEFIRPLTHLDPETPIFTYITHFKQNNKEKGTFNFQAKNLQILDSNDCIPYFYLNNPKIWHRNQLLIDPNPLDLNQDTWINEHDLSHLIDRFGTNEKDENWDPIYDICQESGSLGRVDIRDIRKMMMEVNRQNRFKKIIKEQNPWAELDSVDPALKAEVQAKLKRLLPEYAGSSLPLSTTNKLVAV
ncbi:MAG TPA: hypothetical protein PK581_07480 [Caldisericia bacterium]|nr:hypothetical protein [Caldisericia bacterium]